jgi:hypothetical protein
MPVAVRGGWVRSPGAAAQVADPAPRRHPGTAWQNARMHKRLPTRYLPLLAALAFAIAACTDATATESPSPSAPATPTVRPTAKPTGTYAGTDQEIYARIEAQIEAIRGLDHKATVSPVLLDAKGVSDWLTKANAAQTNHEALAALTKIYIHMGLLPTGASLEQLQLDLLSGQVAGFYDPASKGLYVLSTSGGVQALEKMTFAHEYTHALQDQNFGLDKLSEDEAGQGDRNLARVSLAEGDATMAMTLWSIANMSVDEMMSVVGEPGMAASAKQLAQAPRILRDTLMFPYQDGYAFVMAVHDDGGWEAVDQMYANPPDSTSQIIHPSLYKNKIKPVAVYLSAVPRGLTGWKLVSQDTLGELRLRIWLEGERNAANSADAAAAAVAEWGGDRVGLYEGPNGEWAVVIHTAWRSSTGRDLFFEAANQTTTALGGQYRVCGDDTHVDIAIASHEALVPLFISCNTMG